MRNNLTRSLSGQSNPTPRSTRNSIDGDGGGQLRVKIVKGRGLAGEPRITTYYGETEVAQSTEWNVTVVATTAGPPSHKPHKKITLELREKMTTLRDLKDIVEGHGAALGTVVVDVGSLGGLDENAGPKTVEKYDHTRPEGTVRTMAGRSRPPTAEETPELRQRVFSTRTPV